MPIFNQWPFTQFQEMNLDWIIREMKKLIIKTGNLEEAQKELKEYIDNFIDSVDVQEAVNNKIDDLIDDGYFDSLLSETMVTKFTLQSSISGDLALTKTFDATSGNIAQVNGGIFIPSIGHYFAAVRALDSTVTTLLEIDPGTGIAINSWDITSMGHANSMAWSENVPDLIYVTSGSQNVKTIDITDGTIVTGTQSGYDAVFTDPDGDIILVDGSGDCYDLSGSAVGSFAYSDPVLQDACYANGFLYLLSDVALYQYDYLTGDLVASIALPDKIGGRYVGEAENISFDGSMIILGSYLRNVLPSAPTRSALRVFGFTTVPSSTYHATSKPTSVNISDADGLWLEALDYRGESVKFMLDPLTVFHFASLLEGRFSLRSQSSSAARVKGLYIRDAYFSSYLVYSTADPMTAYPQDIVALYSDIYIARPTQDQTINTAQSAIRTARMGSATITPSNPYESIINSAHSMAVHKPFATVGFEMISSTAISADTLIDLSAFFDSTPPILFVHLYLNRGSAGYYNQVFPLTPVMATDCSLVMNTPEGVYTCRYQFDATGVKVVSRDFKTYDGSSTTPPGGVLPVIQYLYHL